MILPESKRDQFSDYVESSFQSLSKYDYLTRESIELEREKLWSQVWLMGPRLELLKKTYDYVVDEFSGESFIFIRGRDDIIRGFYNVCPHRGSRILWKDKCRGRKTSLVCPYHEWQWDCNGNVQHIPKLECFSQLADTNIVNDLRLQEVKVDTWGGWVWYSMAQNIEPLNDYLAPILEIANLYETDRQITIDYSTIEVECNWKIPIENFLEGYHVNTLHPQLREWMDIDNIPTHRLGKHALYVIDNGFPSAKIQKIGNGLKEFLTLNNIAPESYTSSPDRVRTTVQEAKRLQQYQTIEPYENLADDQLTKTYAFSVFPNINLGLMAESTLVFRHRPHPTDPGRMYIDVTRMCHFDEETEEIPETTFKTFKFKDDPKLTALFAGIMPAPIIQLQLSQDLEIFASVQQGLSSRAFDRFILGEEEDLVKHLHQELSKYIHPSE